MRKQRKNQGKGCELGRFFSSLSWSLRSAFLQVTVRAQQFHFCKFEFEPSENYRRGKWGSSRPWIFSALSEPFEPPDNWKNYSLNVMGLMLATYVNRLLNEANIFTALLTKEESLLF